MYSHFVHMSASTQLVLMVQLNYWHLHVTSHTANNGKWPGKINLHHQGEFLRSYTYIALSILPPPNSLSLSLPPSLTIHPSPHRFIQWAFGNSDVGHSLLWTSCSVLHTIKPDCHERYFVSTKSVENFCKGRKLLTDKTKSRGEIPTLHPPTVRNSATHPLGALLVWRQSSPLGSPPGTHSYHCQPHSPHSVSALDHLPPPPPCHRAAR